MTIPVGRRLLRIAATCTALALASTAFVGIGQSAPPAWSSPPGPSDKHTSDRDRVVIKRDDYGVPHVYADSTRGLFRGYGYSVAQDRLFQMEMSRRSTQGTVSEVLGSAYLAFDKDTRTGFDPTSIRRQIERLPRADKDILEGYAEGMNEYVDLVAARPGKLMPKQFLEYGFSPSRWTAYDVAMVWVGTMANRYSDSSSEISNYQILSELIAAKGEDEGRRLFDQIQWLDDPKAPTTVPRSGAVTLSQPPRVELGKLSPGLHDVGEAMAKRNGAGDGPNAHPEASNVWITGRERTRGAKSVLLNGPQFGWFNPSYVSGIGLHGAGWDFAGNTPFSYPAVIFGTNKTIAWGATAGPLNVVDIYQERLNPSNPRQYFYRGAYRDMGVRTTVIKVKGAADVSHDVLTTVHGFVTSVDTANSRAYSKKRSWSGYEIQSLIAWTKVPRAKSFKEFKALAAQFATTINWYYSDVKGNIGYISPGRIPKRPANQDFRLPARGDGSMEWQGIEPFAKNPLAYNPRQGYLANWNNQPAPGFNNDYGNWSVVDRDQEIVAAFQEQRRFTPGQMRRLNERFSFVDLNLRYLQPTLRQAARSLPAGDPLRQDIRLLTSWDGQTRDRDDDGSYDGPQPAIMRAWLPLLFERVLADDLPAPVYDRYVAGIYQQVPIERLYSMRPAAALKLVYNGMLGPRAGVEQTTDFFDGEDPARVLSETYAEALASLRATRGTDMDAWTTPTSYVEFSHKNFLGVPQASPSESLPGPEYMNRGTANILSVLGPQRRARLCLVAPPGQSGFVAPSGAKSPHYDDQLQLFANFECRNEHLTRRSVDRHTESVTVLR